MTVRIMIALLMVMPVEAAAANLGFWVVNALRTIHPAPPHGDGFRVVTLSGNSRIASADLSAGQLRIVKEIDAARLSPGGIYDLLGSIFADEAFDCIVMSDLKAHQLVAAEHFARAKRILLISSNRDVGVVPFAIDAAHNVVYRRLSTLKHYGLSPARHGPRMELVSLDPIGCPANEQQRRLQWPPERVCYSNANDRQESPEREQWDTAIHELSVAIVIAPHEGIDHSAHRRQIWGRERYHPHYSRATFLGRFASCDIAELELSLSIVPDADKQRVRQDCASRRSLLRLEDTLDELAAAVRDETEPLPPVGPDFIWSGLLSFD